jgi:hypothetical protein
MLIIWKIDPNYEQYFFFIRIITKWSATAKGFNIINSRISIDFERDLFHVIFTVWFWKKCSSLVKTDANWKKRINWILYYVYCYISLMSSLFSDKKCRTSLDKSSYSEQVIRNSIFNCVFDIYSKIRQRKWWITIQVIRDNFIMWTALNCTWNQIRYIDSLSN